MTPKEKAKEIYNSLINRDHVFHHDAIWIANYMVDEIIKANPRRPEISNQHVGGVFYWQQVKEELKKI